MSAKEEKEFYRNADDILRQIKDYSNGFIENGLADIHTRVQDVIKYNEDDSKMQGNPLYYGINNVKTMHAETTTSYYNFTQANDLGDKVKIIGKISTMNRILIDLEKKGESNE